MNSILGLVIAIIIILAVYFVIPALYTTFNFAPYIGTAAVFVTAYIKYPFSDTFTNKYVVPIIYLVLLIIAEIITGLLCHYKKAKTGLIILSCAALLSVLFRLCGISLDKLYGTTIAIILLLGMTVYAFWTSSKHNYMGVRDAGSRKTGVIRSVLIAVGSFIQFNLIYETMLKSVMTKPLGKILAFIIELLLAVLVGIIVTALDFLRISKSDSKYAQLSEQLTQAREHFVTLRNDLDGILVSTPKELQKSACDSTIISKSLNRFKQLKKIDISQITFFEYNDMLRVYPVLMDAFDKDEDEYGIPVPKKHELMSVFFKDCDSKDAVVKRYKQLSKLFRMDTLGGNAETSNQLKKEYELELAKYES